MIRPPSPLNINGTSRPYFGLRSPKVCSSKLTLAYGAREFSCRTKTGFAPSLPVGIVGKRTENGGQMC